MVVYSQNQYKKFNRNIGPNAYYFIVYLKTLTKNIRGCKKNEV